MSTPIALCVSTIVLVLFVIAPGSAAADKRFEEVSRAIQELVDAGNRVFISATVHGRGKQSGAETTWDVWSVWTMRDGRLVRWLGFTERDAALEAAGLQK